MQESEFYQSPSSEDCLCVPVPTLSTRFFWLRSFIAVYSTLKKSMKSTSSKQSSKPQKKKDAHVCFDIDPETELGEANTLYCLDCM